MEIIGETQDDAVGEAFDKAAKLLGLLYPGGPLIDKYAAEGNSNTFKFPSVDTPGLNYSFSGIKTAFLYFLRDNKAKNADFIEKNLNDICASIQSSLIEILMKKLRIAAAQTGITEIAIARKSTIMFPSIGFTVARSRRLSVETVNVGVTLVTYKAAITNLLISMVS